MPGLLATSGAGEIQKFEDMFIFVKGQEIFYLHALPEVNESKTAQYSDVLIIGRSSPLKTYSGSDHRAVSVTFHLHSPTEELHAENLRFIRAIHSLLYPQYDKGYLPPPIAYLKIGDLVSGNVVCTSVNTPYNTDTAWIATSGIDGTATSSALPLHVPLQADFHVVYNFFDLPGSSDVIEGRY